MASPPNPTDPTTVWSPDPPSASLPPSPASPPGPKPGLYRLSRALRIAGVIVIVVILIFVGTAIYSLYTAVPGFVQSGKGGGGGSNFNGALNLSNQGKGEALGFYLPLANSGWYPFQGMAIGLSMTLPSGAVLLQGSSAPQDVPAGGTANLSVSIPVDLTKIGNSTLRSLLTGDTNITTTITLGGTYAYLFPFSISVKNTTEWKAPFYNLQVSIGAPTTSVPTTIQFSNQASFPDDGTIAFDLTSSNGQACGNGSLSLNVPGGGTYYDHTVHITPTSGCNLSGGTESAFFTFFSGPTYALGSEAIP